MQLLKRYCLVDSIYWWLTSANIPLAINRTFSTLSQQQLQMVTTAHVSVSLECYYY